MKQFVPLVLCFVLLFEVFKSVVAYADNPFEEDCSTLLDRDMAYSATAVQGSKNNELRFAVPGGPIANLLGEVFSELSEALVDRLETGFMIEFITDCRKNYSQNVLDAITQTQSKLRLNPSARNWGMKQIDTEKLLSGTCEEFVLFLQENGIGEVFYNDPLRVTLDVYWDKFDLKDDEFEHLPGVESDAQFACSLEPQRKLIDVLDEVTKGYQLFRVRWL